MQTAIIYWSATGNTEKVARAIQEGLEAGGAEVELKRPEEAQDLDFFAYDLLCIGFPSYQWTLPKPMDNYLHHKFNSYKKEGRIKSGAPKIPGKNVLIFCTYSGPHTGINEAIPAGKYAGQFFEHLGFTIVDEWYVVGEFHTSLEHSTSGRLGDIRGKPTDEDLKTIAQDAYALLKKIKV